MHSDRLRESMDLLKRRGNEPQDRLQARLRAFDLRIEKENQAKRRLLDLYATGEVDRTAYIRKSRDFDASSLRLMNERAELIQRIPLLHKKESIHGSIAAFCEIARLRYTRCNDFDTKRQFLLDYIAEIKYRNDRVELYGSVPIKSDHASLANNSLTSVKIGFKILSTISLTDRMISKSPADLKRISMAKHNEILLRD